MDAKLGTEAWGAGGRLMEEEEAEDRIHPAD